MPGQSVCIKVDREYLRQRSDVVCALVHVHREERAHTENTGSRVGAHKSIPRAGGGPRRALPSIDRYLNEYSSAVRGPLWNQSRRHNGSFRRAPISPADRPLVDTEFHLSRRPRVIAQRDDRRPRVTREDCLSFVARTHVVSYFTPLSILLSCRTIIFPIYFNY